MAFYIKLIKTFEDDARATYRFEGHGRVGFLNLAKATGEIVIADPLGVGDDLRR